MVNKWLKYIQSLAVPANCLYCGDELDERLALCRLCQQHLPWLESACRCCAQPVPEPENGARCGNCLNKPPAFDRVLSPFIYRDPVSQLITRFKFQADLAAGQLLATLLADYLQAQRPQQVTGLVPVPLHTARLRRRGFNQSLELARVVGKRLGIPVLADACVRQRNTLTQTGLNEKQRIHNVRGAFSLRQTLTCQDLAIIDDVITTGNTANELAKTLRKAGARSVQVWSVSRAGNLGS
ncbi:MAG: ComF family protein [Thioalkalispiraceae bacterium]|jgi:ComF family protein